MPTPTIVPAILSETLLDMQKQVRRLDGLFPYVQLDIMDGKFVHKRSFPEVEQVAEIGTSLQYELHLMVLDPIAEMKKWANIRNVFRVITHIEAPAQVEECRAFAKAKGWEFGLAINPDTPFEVVMPYLDKIDVLQFMTVYPGRQGAPFQPKVLAKIEQFASLTTRPRGAVDGGITPETIKYFKDSSAIEILNVGSALLLAPEIDKAYTELQMSLQ